MSETKRMIVINKSISNKPEKSSVGLKSRRVKPNVVVRPTTLKKALLERIKKHQQRVHQHKNNDGSNYPIIAPPSITPSKPPVNTNATSFSNDFTESMEFLKQLAEKRKKTMKFRKLSQPMSTSTSMSAPMTMSTPMSTSMPMSTPTVPMSAPILNPTPTSNNTTTTMPNQGMFPAPLVNVQVAPPPPYSYTNTNTIEPIRNLDLNPQFTSFEYGVNDEPKQPVIQFGENTQKEIPSNDDGDNGEEQEQEQQEEPEPEPPSIFIKPEPDHGCLKGGKKPTFREWVKKTLKKPAEVIKEFLQGNTDENEQENDVNENDINENDINESGVPNDGKIAGLRMKIRKTTTKKFRVGKHGNVVGVLLKNKHTQRHIQKEHLSLKQKSLNEIKKYLYDKNLLKIGSSAPPDVLRRLYEDSILTGEVQNTGKGVALHNFMAKDDEN